MVGSYLGLAPRLYDIAPFGAWDERCGWSDHTWGSAPGCMISPRSGLGVRGVDGRIIPGARARLYDIAPFGAWGEVSGSSGTWGWRPGLYDFAPFGAWDERCGWSDHTWGSRPRLYDIAPFGAWDERCGWSDHTWGSRPRLYDIAPFGAWDEVSGSSGTWGWRPRLYDFAPFGAWDERCGWSDHTWGSRQARAPGFMILPRSGL